MKPEYIRSFVPSEKISDFFQLLVKQVPWLEVQANRKECFMATKPVEYSYGNFHGSPIRPYKSVGFHPIVYWLMLELNKQFGADYNVCFLNRYDDENKSLGWHADDSPEMNMAHPIAVISFGEEREIWWRPKEQKGPVPADQRMLLHSGSVFIMPTGFQRDHYHRIPKGDRPKQTRVSLTFRNYLEHQDAKQ